jgi:triacylglycerol lipase
MSESKAIQCALLSQEVYKDFSQSPQFSGFPGITPELIEKTDTDTQCAILSDTTGDSIYIVFRGSEKRQDWNTNLNFKRVELEFEQEVIQKEIVQPQEKVYPYEGKSSSGAKMHQGFVSAYFSVREKVHDYLKSQSTSNLIVTGHSLGGALATLCAVDVQYNFGERYGITIYTFGAPRVGNDGFRQSFNRRVPNSYRYVNGMDIVPALPRPWQGYRHVDQEYRLGSRFSLQFFSQRFEDHDIANYIAALRGNR